MNGHGIDHGLCVALGQIGQTFGLKILNPAIGHGAGIDLFDRLAQLICNCGGIGHDAYLCRKVAANRSGLQLYMDDLGVTVDVIVAVESGVKSDACSQRQNHIRLFHQTRGHDIAARPHLPGIQRVTKRHRIPVAGRSDHRTIKRLGQGHTLIRAACVLDTAARNDNRARGRY